MRALGGFDDPVNALFVGGCVRNALLDKPSTDIDIATIHRPDAVIKILSQAGIRTIPTGLEHGTVTAIVNDAKFEITTLRKDVETDGRHAVIAFTNQWSEDAERRDFTINTLLMSPDGTIYDTTKRGLADLKARKIIFVGEPKQRIAEDYLRILRYFRFHGQYGVGDADSDALTACKELADKVRLLSRERVTQEFMKIIGLQNAADILKMMFDIGVMSTIQHQHYKSATMDRLVQLQLRNTMPDNMTRICLVAEFDTAMIEGWLVLSNSQKQQVENTGKVFEGLKTTPKKKVRELVYHYGNALVMQAYLLRLAVHDNHPDLEIIDTARYWQAPVFPIGGEDLKSRGILPGRDMGQKLKALEEGWIKSDFKKIPKY